MPLDAQLLKNSRVIRHQSGGMRSASMSKWVMRVKGWSYEGGEHSVDCWLGKNGSIYNTKTLARIYDSEAEAWEHARAAGHLFEGNEDEEGLVCWTEEIPNGQEAKD
jgi:hypothetical protein